MKKKYVKPMMAGEQFVASEYIARCNTHITIDELDGANCVNPAHYEEGVVSQSREGHSPGSGRVENVYTEKSTNCGTIIESEGAVRGDYFGTRNGQTLFEFNNRNNFQSKGYAPEKSFCYGALRSQTSSDTTLLPFS